jgi:glycosyltransferase involved in cell wall biosynthesis
MALTRAGAGQWDGLIVLCAVKGYDGFKMADWHVAEHLSKLSPVLYVDPPASVLGPARQHRAALPNPRLRLQRPGLARLTPIVQPFPSRRGSAGMTAAIARGYLRRAAARLGGQVRAVISGWPQYPVFGTCGEQVRVYWARDDFVGGAALLGLNGGLLDARERRVAAGADLVVAASPVVADTWRHRGLDPILVPYGTDVDAYRCVGRWPRPADVCLPAPIAGFVGRLNERTDLRLLEAVAARGRSLLLVGPKDPAFEPRRFDALRRLRNVRWVGPKASDALPGYLRLIDVGLVPYTGSAFNRGSFPLKTLEYLAAGRAVVATDLPATRWLATDLICIAGGAVPFADQVDRLLAMPRTPAVLAERQAFAARHSWAQRAAQIHAAIAGRAAGPAPASAPGARG